MAARVGVPRGLDHGAAVRALAPTSLDYKRNICTPSILGINALAAAWFVISGRPVPSAAAAGTLAALAVLAGHRLELLLDLLALHCRRRFSLAAYSTGWVRDAGVIEKLTETESAYFKSFQIPRSHACLVQHRLPV
jgi:hypothetical protein